MTSSLLQDKQLRLSTSCYQALTPKDKVYGRLARGVACTFNKPGGVFNRTGLIHTRAAGCSFISPVHPLRRCLLPAVRPPGARHARSSIFFFTSTSSRAVPAHVETPLLERPGKELSSSCPNLAGDRGYTAGL